MLPVDKKEQAKEYRRCLTLSKVVATVLCMAIVLGFFAILAYFILPQMIQSVIELIETMPNKLQALSEWFDVHLHNVPQVGKWLDNLANAGTTEIISWLQKYVFADNIEDLATMLSTQVLRVAAGFVDLFIGLLISIYLLNYKETIFANCRKIIAAVFSENRAKNLYEFGKIINETFIGFIVGRILDAIVIGILTYIVMMLLHMPLALLISVIVGVTNVIPFFGPFLGAIPSFCLLMLEDPIQACYFVVMILVIQQIDGNVIGPKIVGSAIGIGSFWVLIAVLIGGGLFGFLGMALGVPTFAVVYRYVGKFTNNQLRKRDRTIKTSDYVDYQNYGIDKNELLGGADGEKNGTRKNN